MITRIALKKLKQGLFSKDTFYNILTNRAIRDECYEHVLNVWKAFKMNNMKHYHDLYLKADVLFLAHVHETFKKRIHKFLCIRFCSSFI